ncbi:MAG: hypothetical protein K6F63_04175 [Lachnospiraceae bacterium]|nr:hypothetical protein [Lachnospiraceae bacterium]
MNKLKKSLYFVKIFFSDHVGILSMMLFHIVTSACFFIAFFSVGINVYKEVVRMSENIGRDDTVSICFRDDDAGFRLLEVLEESFKGRYTIDEGEEPGSVKRAMLGREAFVKLEGELDLTKYFVVEENDNVGKISGIVKLVRFIICVFGLLFTVLASVHIVDLFDLLIERNTGKLFMLSALGYYERDMKKVIAVSGVVIAFAGSLPGTALCLLGGSLVKSLGPELSIFGVSVAGMVEIKWYISILCFVVLSICMLAFSAVSLKKLNGEDIAVGLKEMEE